MRINPISAIYPTQWQNNHRSRGDQYSREDKLFRKVELRSRSEHRERLADLIEREQGLLWKA